MRKQHREILRINHDFLVSEMPMGEVLEAINSRNILTPHDGDQLRTLRHQGRKALARYFLGVLPHRGPDAFQALLDSLQDANAQHLVDLLLEQAQSIVVKDGEEEKPPSTPSDSPLPTGPDPHEYVVLLTRNNKLIRRFVDPAKISPILTQNKVMTPREADLVTHLHGKNKKWDLIFAVLLQRGERAYQAFMAALLKNEYSTVFHTIKDTSTRRSRSEDDSDVGRADNDDDDDDDDDDDNYNNVNAGRVNGGNDNGTAAGVNGGNNNGTAGVNGGNDNGTAANGGNKNGTPAVNGGKDNGPVDNSNSNSNSRADGDGVDDVNDDDDNNYDEVLESDEEIKAELDQTAKEQLDAQYI